MSTVMDEIHDTAARAHRAADDAGWTRVTWGVVERDGRRLELVRNTNGGRGWAWSEVRS